MADGIPRIVTRPEPGSPPPTTESYPSQTNVGSCNLGQSPISYPPNASSAEIQLSAVSAKTRLLPPITYWEKYSGPQGSGNHAESVWRQLKFFLKLRISSAGIRYFNLHCFPLHPFGQSPEIIKFTWSITGGQAGIKVGIKSGEHYVDFRLRAEGKYTQGSVSYPPLMQNHWTTIPESLRDAMRSAGGLINLRVVPENEADLPVLKSFFLHTKKVNERYSDLQVAEPRPARPQTNPHLDPLIYDPFPGIPISLGRTPPKLPEAKSKSSTPGEPSQVFAAMELSDGGAENGHRNENHPKTPSSDIESKRSSSSAWSFLENSREQNHDASSSSSSSPQSLMPLLPAPVTLKSPPVMVKLESESESNMQITVTRRRKSKRLGDAGRGEGKAEDDTEVKGVKEKRNKKRRDVAESSAMGEGGGDAHDGNEDAEDGDEEAEAERKRKKKERKKKRRNKDPDNDGDIEMETDVQSVDTRPTKKKTRKSRRKALLSNSESPILMQSPPPKAKKNKGKEKNKEKQSESRSNDPPPIKPSRSGSEIRRSTKRKHSDPDSGDNDEVDGEKLSRRRERLKKRINEINMEKHELRVEEEELKAKLLRLDFTTRKLDTGAIRAHCVCSACKKYGHKKNSVICEMHPDAIRIAAWRGS